jgi:hypothetical protein
VAISHIGTNHATVGSGTSVTVTKPASTANDDLLLAFFTSNNQNCTPPAGWTEIADEVIEVFRAQVFYKVAGSSEPANYQFSVGGGGSNTPIVCSVACLRGIDDASPIDITAVAETDTSHSEPYTTPGLTGGTAGRLVYFRTVRVSSSTPPTFTASSVTELKDVGVFSGGSVSYSQGLYLANADYSGGGSKSGLGITCSGSDTHNFVLTLGVKAEAGLTATMGLTMPSIPSVDMAANWAYAATLNTSMPLPTMTSNVFVGSTEGTLDTVVPITVSLAGSTPVRGTLDVMPSPIVEITGETRFFADNVVLPVREERWFIMTQDGYRMGIRFGVDIPMRIEMPLPQVAIVATTVSHAGQVPDIPAEAFEPTEIIVIFSAATTAVTAEAYDATVLRGALAPAEEVNVTGVVETWAEWADAPATFITVGAEHVAAISEATNLIGFSAIVDSVSATATAYNPAVGNAKEAFAEHVSVSVVANSIATGISNANAGHASASAAASAPQVQIKSNSGHAAISCHN